MKKIQKVSLFFRVLFQMLFIAMPIIATWSWIYAPDELVLLNGVVKMNAIPNVYLHKILHTLTHSEKIIGWMLSFVPLSVYLFILYSLIKLFRLYEQGEIFSINNVKYIRHVGYALFMSQVIEPFYQFIMGFVLTLNNPHGQRLAAITLDQANIGMLLTGLMLILISWIMTEGCHLREEQQLTI